MKQTHRGLARLLSAGMSLALLTSLVPGATAASRNVEYEVDGDEVLSLEKEDFDNLCMTKRHRVPRWMGSGLQAYPRPVRVCYILTMTAETNMRSKSERALPAET